MGIVEKNWLMPLQVCQRLNKENTQTVNEKEAKCIERFFTHTSPHLLTYPPQHSLSLCLSLFVLLHTYLGACSHVLSKIQVAEGILWTEKVPQLAIHAGNGISLSLSPKQALSICLFLQLTHPSPLSMHLISLMKTPLSISLSRTFYFQLLLTVFLN